MAAPDPEKIRQVTEEVLSRPEFADTEPEKSFWLEWIEDFFDYLADLNIALDASPTLKWVIVGVLSAILALLLGHIIYTIISEVRLLRSGEPTPTLAPARVSLADGRHLSWDEASRLAQDAYAAKRYHEAISIAHRLVLHWFDHHNLIEFLKWKTNLHYLSECPVDHPQRSLLEESTNLYEQIVYAHAKADGSGIQKLLQRLAKIKAR